VSTVGQQYATHLDDEKRCAKCEVVLPKDAFFLRNKDRAGAPLLTSWCKTCLADFARVKGRARYVAICEIKLAHGCADCGYNAHPAALEFDHLPGHEKLFAISSCSRFSWERILDEMAKCDVVCANCHVIRTVDRAAQARSEKESA